MGEVFTHILDVVLPIGLACEASSQRTPEFVIRFSADGVIPFPQVILWDAGQAHLVKGGSIRLLAGHVYEAVVPARTLGSGTFRIQLEGCRRADIEHASGGDWIKTFVELVVAPAAPGVLHPATAAGQVRLYFGIHKHMHQPYYDAVSPESWDGAKDDIFATRRGPYTEFIPAAVRQYIDGSLLHAGLSTSWSGSLIAQLERCARDGLCGGAFAGWNRELRGIAEARTALGHPRVGFTAFGFHHPLMPLIPERDIVRSIEWHRDIIRRAFGVEPSRVLFPPETAFHVRIIPALRRAGVEVVIYDSIHRFRACRDYPYAGTREGMLPPNRAEQENPPVNDWMQLQNIWAASPISPKLLRPEVIKYEDPDGKVTTIIGVPAERYIGNEDARGGFGALQYPSVLGQLYDRIAADGTFDPKRPPFFVLHSDGDNHGGGADSYYKNNTGELVKWLQQDGRFELTSIEDYLERFPPDASRAVHLEPGAWSGADNGDPQFRKWFSRYEESYSPDLNSWAVLTALQNLVHSLEDTGLGSSVLLELQHLMLRAETSCYWYWTGQEVWDRQVTNAANRACDLAASVREAVARDDVTAPTIFPPWVMPENPGGKTWGRGGLVDAGSAGTVHTFVHDVSGLRSVELIIRSSAGEERVAMLDLGPYPSQTGAKVAARHFTALLPVGGGDLRYYVEAVDNRENRGRSGLERIFMG